MRNLLFTASLLLSLATYAQNTPGEVPAPGKAQAKPIWITGATLHLGNGQAIQGIIGFDKGKITYVGSGAEIRLNRNEADIIDATGKHVYPGFIAFNSILGLNEVDAVRATRDYAETGELNPNVRALIAYNTDSRITPTVRNNGTLLSQIAPQGGRISGRSSVVHFDAWNWEDATVRAEDGMHFNWPSMRVYDAWWAPPADEQRKRSAEQMAAMEQFMEDAKAYLAQSKPDKINLKLEAMREVMNGKCKVYVHTGEAKSMITAVNFFAKYNLRPVIVGADEAGEIVSFLRDKQIPLILSRTQRLPGRNGDPIDAPFTLPAQLAAAGIPFGLMMDGAWEQRNIPFQAGQAVGYGLAPERAVQALTGDAARILGIDANYGTLETGKSATLFLSTGDALDIRGNKLEAAFIDGRRLELSDKQTGLYKKFSEKYGVEAP